MFYSHPRDERKSRKKRDEKPKAAQAKPTSTKEQRQAAPSVPGYESLLGGLDSLDLGGQQPLVAAAMPTPIVPGASAITSNGIGSSFASTLSSSSVVLPKTTLLSHVAGGGLQVMYNLPRRENNNTHCKKTTFYLPTRLSVVSFGDHLSTERNI